MYNIYTVLSIKHSPPFLLSENPQKTKKHREIQQTSPNPLPKTPKPPVVKDCWPRLDRWTNQGTPRALKRHGPRRGRGTRPRQISVNFRRNEILEGFQRGAPLGCPRKLGSMVSKWLITYL